MRISREWLIDFNFAETIYGIGMVIIFLSKMTMELFLWKISLDYKVIKTIIPSQIATNI